MKSKLKEELRSVKHEVRNKTAGYIVTALGLVAGLAWNDAIKSLIEFYFPLTDQSVWAKLIYAVIITLVIVLVSVYIMKILKKEEDKSKGKNEE